MGRLAWSQVRFRSARVATHDEALVELADKVIVLEDGSVTSIEGG
jgi:ABC-type lipoprotein export system ATPase subunit